MGAIETKTFKSGNSVAVRLPKELGFEADIRVTVERDGNGVSIQPVIDPSEENASSTTSLPGCRRSTSPAKSAPAIHSRPPIAPVFDVGSDRYHYRHSFP